MSAFTIGKLAHEGGVGVESVRFYQRKGLLEEPSRPASGHRHYGPQHLQRLRFIRRARSLGFGVAEIAGFLELMEDPDGPSCDIQERVWAKVAELETRIAGLTALKDELVALGESCDGIGPRHDCEILRHLSAEPALDDVE